jgi:hypothetical protein
LVEWSIKWFFSLALEKKLSKAKHSSLFGHFATDVEVKKPGTVFITLKLLRDLRISPISQSVCP